VLGLQKCAAISNLYACELRQIIGRRRRRALHVGKGRTMVEAASDTPACRYSRPAKMLVLHLVM
jgi:hypothetical protein